MANTITDLANGTDHHVSLYLISGANDAFGRIVDLLHADNNCNMFVTGFGSGPLELRVQTSDATTSGTFTDPTSGLPANAFPIGGRIASGGIFWANSGLYLSGASSPAASVDAAPIFCSGGVQYASFQRPHRYARIWCTSGNASLAAVPFHAGFISQKKVTGASGTAAGFSYSPGSGTVNV